MVNGTMLSVLAPGEFELHMLFMDAYLPARHVHRGGHRRYARSARQTRREARRKSGPVSRHLSTLLHPGPRGNPHWACPRARIAMASNNSMQRAALRAAADAERPADMRTMRRREFAILLGAAAVLQPRAGRAQQPTIPVVGLPIAARPRCGRSWRPSERVPPRPGSSRAGMWESNIAGPTGITIVDPAWRPSWSAFR
jgi:hypothetical protein